MINFIKKWFMCKEIRSKTGILHFQRYRIIQTPWFGIFIHYIERSDEDKDPHNHPWNFLSIILKDSYTEELYDRTLTDYVKVRWRRHVVKIKRFGFLSFLYRNFAYDFHKITVHSPVWSLVFTGPRVNPKWGYLTDSEFIDFKTYRELKNNPQLAVVEEVVDIPKVTRRKRKKKAN